MSQQDNLLKQQQDELKARQVKYFQFQFTTLLGGMHCMEEAADLYTGFAKTGFAIDGSSIPGFLALTASDLTVMPNPETFHITTDHNTTYGYCWSTLVDDENKPHPGCVRSILRRTVEKANRMGYKVEMFGELEFFLFNKDGTPQDSATYTSMPPEDKGVEFRHRLGDLMLQAGVQPKRLHHEVGPGQNEIELKFTEAMKNGDDMVRGMWLARMLADEMGLVCDFMPKPRLGLAGSGLHEHTILRDSYGKNVFSGPLDGLSEVAMNYIGGLTKYAREICACFAMSDQTFERLKPGFEAPIYAAWDMANRTALVRVPHIIPGTEDKTRIEFRGGDASGSPHLLSTLILGAGLKGIEEHLLPPQRRPGFDYDTLTVEQAREAHIDMLPGNMEEAVQVFEHSAFLRELLGEHAFHFLLEKKKRLLVRKN